MCHLVESRKRNAFAASDLRFLNTLAGQVVTVIESARLYNNLVNYTGQLANDVHHRTLEFESERDRTLAILDSFGEAISLLLQVLRNLLPNALAYSPPGGREHVEKCTALKDGRPMVWLRVEDKGPGISSSEIPRPFDRCCRGEAALCSGAPRTGLGPSISKEILEIYGGTFELHSAPGQGTSFTVWCPKIEKPAGVVA